MPDETFGCNLETFLIMIHVFLSQTDHVHVMFSEHALSLSMYSH